MRHLAIPGVLLVFAACHPPTAPDPPARNVALPREIVLAELRVGDSVLVDYSLEGCFIQYDAQFLIVRIGQRTVLSGTVTFPRVTPGPSEALIPPQELTDKDVGRLDRMLDMYRTEARSGGCTGTTRMHLVERSPTGSTSEESWFDASCITVKHVRRPDGSHDLVRRNDALFLSEFASRALLDLFSGER